MYTIRHINRLLTSYAGVVLAENVKHRSVVCLSVPLSDAQCDSSSAAAASRRLITVHDKTQLAASVGSGRAVREPVLLFAYYFVCKRLPLLQVIIKKGSPYSITEGRVPELIPVLGSQPAGDVSHKPGGRLPLLSARLQLPPQPIRGLLPVLLLGEPRP